jgi:hypothetical protein
MGNLKITLKNALLGTALLAMLALTGVCVVPKIAGLTASVSTVQHVERNVYNGLTIFSDDEENLDTAKIVLKAPIEAEIGELVRFDVSASWAKSFKWVLVPESGDFEVYDGGKRAVFSGRKSGEYMFIVACAYENTVDVIIHTVRVGTPIPKPGDYPVVAEPEADALFSEWLPYWCSLTVRTEAETRKLADGFDSVAAKISAGVYTTPEEIIKATGEANRLALGDSLEAWKMVLLSLQNEFKARADAGTLASPEQHADMWREVAAGLRAYADLFETLK